MSRPWETDLEVPENGEPLRFSIVIPTFNSARRIGWTLQSLETQTYPHLEVIVVDAGSTDATIEVVQRSQVRARIYTVAEYNVFDMYNRGISLASGRYIALLSPGDSYLARETIQHMASLAHTNEEPHLLFCGSLMRDPGAEPKPLLHTLSGENLRKGLQPTSFQACWCRADTLHRLGKLNPEYRLRAGFDLFCRYVKEEGLTTVFSERVLVERDRRHFTPRQWARRSFETFKIIHRHFGLFATARWWLHQNHWRVVGWWWKSRRPHLWS